MTTYYHHQALTNLTRQLQMQPQHAGAANNIHPSHLGLPANPPHPHPHDHLGLPAAALTAPNPAHPPNPQTLTHTTQPPPPAAMPGASEDHGIRDVWAHSLTREMAAMAQVIKTHKYIALDTEFPGVVARPIGEFRSTAEYTYHQMRCNVNLLKIIQIGFTMFDQHGNRASPVSTWQFNFKFNLGDDMYAQESIDLLRKSGIQFEKHETDGIDPEEFAAQLTGSGMVLMKNTFLSFHSGYDFGYLIKMLTGRELDEECKDFFDTMSDFCEEVYDVKYMMKSCKDLKGGLQEVSDYLQIKRVGPQHQAGSDSLLTGMAFFKMRELYFESHMDKPRYSMLLYGLGLHQGTGAPAAAALTAANGQTQPSPFTQPDAETPAEETGGQA